MLNAGQNAGLDAMKRDILDAKDSVAVILGGPGAGKTTLALSAAALQSEAGGSRALFLSFSRTAVAQIRDRGREFSGPRGGVVDIFTFHGFCHWLIWAFGGYYGYDPGVKIMSQAEVNLFRDPSRGLTYDDLLRTGCDLVRIPTVSKALQRRYSLVICDEFQDTGDVEWELFRAIAPGARRMVLGDEDQEIYSALKSLPAGGRLENARSLNGAVVYRLPSQSFRDRSGVFPAMAKCFRERDFTSPILECAVTNDRVKVHRVAGDALDQAVLRLAATEAASGRTVDITTHTNASVADLADAMNSEGIVHQVVGGVESLVEAFNAQTALLGWALREQTEARKALAVFCQAAGRGRAAKDLASGVLLKELPGVESGLKEICRSLRLACEDTPIPYRRLIGPIARVPSVLSLPQGQASWDEGLFHLRSSLAMLECGMPWPQYEGRLREWRARVMLDEVQRGGQPIRLMNMHQAKGREADVSILVLRADEYYGPEQEPYKNTSKLGYVCLTRARERVHIVCPRGAGVHGLWVPFVNALEAAAEAEQTPAPQS